ncbi:hypothetical protein PLESTM_001771400 [Pleodorina starrii]|nr:hypothetical protein PLESTM_001771400 [Pleodorina starrii]
MASPRWRILACSAAPTRDSGVGVFSALLDLAAPETQPQNVQVSVLFNPSLTEFGDAVAANRPNLIYCCGSSSQQDDNPTNTIGPFHFRDGSDLGEGALLKALAEAQAEVVYMDAAVSPHFGWTDVRLLAPRAELRLLLVGDSGLIDSTRLSFLGEALRALLVMEVRDLKLVSRTPLDKLPRTLPGGCQAVRCQYATASGASGSVVLGAPPSVLEHEGLVQHALRMTLVTDSVSLQFRLPPPGLSLPAPRTSQAVAGGLPLVDTVAVTSLWAVEVLRSLCREQRYRSLAALGVAAVGNMADGAFTAADVRRMEVLVAGSWSPPSAAPPPLIAMTASEPVPAAAPQPGGEALPSPAAAAAPPSLDLTAAAASGGAYFGNDALMGYALTGHLQHLAGGGGAGADGTAAAAAGTAAAASPDSPGGGGAGGEGPSGLGTSASGAGIGFGIGGVGGFAAGAGAGFDGSPEGNGNGYGNGGDPGSRGPGRPVGPLSDKPPNFTGDLPGYTCRRPPLSCCSETQFYDDLVEFLTLLRGKPIDRSRFPEAVLNGVSLDLFSLYREVVTRGGFRVGNGINWKGQVFPRMRNWTETNKQTGVGNALKRHYQNYLWEYEVAHPEDVTTDRCVLCNGGDTVSSDWVCCDACENWAHFSCDKRPGIGAFKDYATGAGRVYVCPSCAREQEAGEAVKRQRTA